MTFFGHNEVEPINWDVELVRIVLGIRIIRLWATS